MHGPGVARLGRGLALIAILLGAIAARFVDLEVNPGGLFPDEAAEALSAREILRDPTYRPIFIPWNGGREALYAYSVAAGFAVGGESEITLRAVAALWGVLGVLGIWLLARRFGTGAGLAAAAWAAGSLWLIAISRDGMRNTITPVFCALALLALAALADRPTRRMAVIAGATMALATLHTYQALKLLPLLALIWLLWLRRVDRSAYRGLIAQAPAFLVSFAIVSAPMIVFAISDPQAYLGRVVGVSAFNPALADTDVVAHVLRVLGMFAFTGDPNPRHDVAGLPLLSWPLALLAIIGVGALWRRRHEAGPVLILLSLPVFMIPPLIAIEGGSPHFLRALGLAAPLAVTVGVGAQAVARRLATLLTRAARPPGMTQPTAVAVSAGAIGALLVALGIGSTWTYLHRPEVDRYAAFSGDVVAMALLSRPSADLVIVNDFDLYTVRFVQDDPGLAHIQPGKPIATAGIDRVLALSLEELRLGLGVETAAQAEAVAWDPLGQPTVWAVALE